MNCTYLLYNIPEIDRQGGTSSSEHLSGIQIASIWRLYSLESMFKLVHIPAKRGKRKKVSFTKYVS